MAHLHGDGDWQVMLAALARQVLEVERGLRPPGHLERLLPDPAYRRWQHQRATGWLAGGPVTPADIGPVRFSRTRATLHASIPTATSTGRWGALSLQLKRHPDGTWAIVDLRRLVPGRRYDRHPDPTTARHQEQPSRRTGIVR